MNNEHLNIGDDQLGDDEIIKHNQRTRLAYVKHMTGEAFPSDPKEMSIVLAAMSDMDRAALGNKKIGVNEKQAAADALVANAIGQIGKHYGSMNPFETQTPNSTPPNLDVSQVPEANPVPGETDVGVSDQTYDEFIKRFED